MKIQTSELQGAALEYAVAMCEGRTIRHDPMAMKDGSHWIWEETPSGQGGIIISKSIYMKIGGKYSPSSDWSQGGPIIEQNRLVISPCPKHNWRANSYMDLTEYYGNTPLVAAMRCYVASRLGDCVDVPDELCGV